MPTPCKHPLVRIVAREDDAEFVECQSCREVFDSAEYGDIGIEESEESQALHARAPTAKRRRVRV